MQQYLKALSWFNENWPNFPKDKIYASSSGKRRGYSVAFETDSLQVLLGILRGPKGGITSHLIIVDTSQPIEVDRLLCCDYSIGVGNATGMATIVHLEVNNGKQDFSDISHKFILAEMRRWKDNCELARAEADIIGFGRNSILAFSGGAVSPR